jgi:hypothetical protein
MVFRFLFMKGDAGYSIVLHNLSSHRGHERMVVGFIPTYICNQLTKVVSSNPTQVGVLDTTLCDKVFH